jgi:hypothetical protein
MPTLLEVAVNRDDTRLAHEVRLLAEGAPIAPIEGELRYHTRAGRGRDNVRALWALAAKPAKTARLTLTIRRDPALAEENGRTGLMLKGIHLSPVVRGPLRDEAFPRPEVPLSRLRPAATELQDRRGKLAWDRLPGKGAFAFFCGVFERGLVPEAVGSVTYKVEERYARFVAVVSAREGHRYARAAVLLDGREVWRRNDLDALHLWVVDVPIPAGSRRITLKMDGRSRVVWAEPGFLTR